MVTEMAQGIDFDGLSSTGLSTHSSVGTVGTIDGGSVVGVRIDAAHKRNTEDDYTLGPLPPMWEKAYTPTGEAYFIDHNTGTSHWLDPRLARVRKRSLGECGEDELPYGWERVEDERYGTYFVDHINRRTQYENPVLQARRIRDNKMTPEPPNGELPPVDDQPEPSTSRPSVKTPRDPSLLRGERFTVTLVKSAQGLGFTLVSGTSNDSDETDENDGFLQIKSIAPHSPAWMDGRLRPGDVLVSVCGRIVLGATHSSVVTLFQSIPPGTQVPLELCRGYKLAYDPTDPALRVLTTLAVDARDPRLNSHTPHAMQQLTHALRSRFNLESPTKNSEGSITETEKDQTLHNSRARRLMSRSFDLDEIATVDESMEGNSAPPRCPSADHLLNHNTDLSNGTEFNLKLRRGTGGFGFTIADSVNGQKVKKVLDRSRCSGLREGDLLLEIGGTDVRHMPHSRVVQVLKDCPALEESTVKIWRARAPRSKSAARAGGHMSLSNGNQLGRSKTPTAEQLRVQNGSPTIHHERVNGEDTYAIPDPKRDNLLERRRRNSTPGGRLSVPNVQTDLNWNDNQQTNWERQEQNPDPLQWRLQQNEQWNQNWNSNGNQNEQSQWLINGQNQWQNTNSERWLDNSNGNRWNENGNMMENRNGWNDGTRNWLNNTAHLDNQGWLGNNNPNGWHGDNWDEVGTPTVPVDSTSYWNNSCADSSDNGGFPEDGVMQAPTTAAITNLQQNRINSPSRIRQQSPPRTGSPSVNSGNSRQRGVSPSSNRMTPCGTVRSHSPANNSSSGRLRANSPGNCSAGAKLRHQSPSCFNCHTGGGTDSPMTQSSQHTHYPGGYSQLDNESNETDVVVRIERGVSGFGFRIVGGIEDGSRVAVGHVVPGGPAEGLLRAGDLLTSVDGQSMSGATHARAVTAVTRAASNGQVTLGIRHNRADIQSNGNIMGVIPPQPNIIRNIPGEMSNGSMSYNTEPHYNILHPAPVYTMPQDRYMHQYEAPPSAGSSVTNYNIYNTNPPSTHQYNTSQPYNVTLSRNDGEGFGFVVISSTNKATSTIGQIIPNSAAARCGQLRVGDAILAINHTPIRNLLHPDVVSLIKHSGSTCTLTVQRI